MEFFLDVSQIGYEGDCRAFETPIGQILYEFKNYDHNVNRDQVSKFIRFRTYEYKVWYFCIK